MYSQNSKINPKPQGEGVRGRTWEADGSGGRLSPESAPTLPAVWKQGEAALHRPTHFSLQSWVSKLLSLWHWLSQPELMGTHLGAELGPDSRGLMVGVSFTSWDSYTVKVKSSCVFLGSGQAQHRIALNDHYRRDSITVGWLSNLLGGGQDFYCTLRPYPTF